MCRQKAPSETPVLGPSMLKRPQVLTQVAVKCRERAALGDGDRSSPSSRSTTAAGRWASGRGRPSPRCVSPGHETVVQGPHLRAAAADGIAISPGDASTLLPIAGEPLSWQWNPSVRFPLRGLLLLLTTYSSAKSAARCDVSCVCVSTQDAAVLTRNTISFLNPKERTSYGPGTSLRMPLV